MSKPEPHASLAHIRALIPSWKRHLKAQNKSERTIQSYEEAALQFAAFLEGAELPVEVGHIERSHVEAFMAHLLGRWRPSTASNRYKSLQQLFRWLVDEDEITASPMDKMRPPKVPDEPVPVLTDERLEALLKACAGKDFESRRDTAIVRAFLDTGARLSELAGLQLERRGWVSWSASRGRGFDFDRQNARGVERHRGASPQETLERLARVASRRSTPPAPLDSRLVEEVVHVEDIRRPLGLARSYPREAVVGSLRLQARPPASFGGAKELVARI